MNKGFDLLSTIINSVKKAETESKVGTVKQALAIQEVQKELDITEYITHDNLIILINIVVSLINLIFKKNFSEVLNLTKSIAQITENILTHK